MKLIWGLLLLLSPSLLAMDCRVRVLKDKRLIVDQPLPKSGMKFEIEDPSFACELKPLRFAKHALSCLDKSSQYSFSSYLHRVSRKSGELVFITVKTPESRFKFQTWCR